MIQAHTLYLCISILCSLHGLYVWPYITLFSRVVFLKISRKSWCENSESLEEKKRRRHSRGCWRLMYFNAGKMWIAGGSSVILGPVYILAIFVVMVNAIFSFRRMWTSGIVTNLLPLQFFTWTFLTISLVSQRWKSILTKPCTHNYFCQLPPLLCWLEQCTDAGSIPARELLVDEFFSPVPGFIFHVCTIFTGMNISAQPNGR